MQMMWMSVVIITILSFLVSVNSQHLVEDTFENIKNTGAEQLVVFYRSSESGSSETLRIINKVAKGVKKEIPRFGFKKCDGDLAVNKKDFEEAQFVSGSFIFTATPSEGIVKYSGPVTVKALKAHILHKFLTFDAEDVSEFTDEESFYASMDESDSPRPIFVKFYEQWCEHCKRLKETFQIAATHFKDRVQFMEVECSKSDDTTSFCGTNEVKSYPVLMLFTGEEKIQYKEEMRSISAFQTFFDKHLPGAPATSASKSSDSSTNDDDEEPAQPAPPAPKRTDTPPPPAPPAAAATKKPKNGGEEEDGVRGSGKKGKKAKAPAAAAAALETNDDDALSQLGKFAPSKALSTEDRVAALEAQVAALSDKIDQLLKR